MLRVTSGVRLAVLTVIATTGAACRDVQPLVACQSPDGRHVATFYSVMGGGAAGYAYGRLNLRAASEDFDADDYVLELKSGHDARLRWQGADSLLVEYPRGARVDSAALAWGAPTIALRYDSVPALGGAIVGEDGDRCAWLVDQEG